MGAPNLRVTRRCLTEDLGLSGDLVQKDAREFSDDHVAVGKFVQMRGVAPDAGEPIGGNYKRGTICSLHVSSARAVTTYDVTSNVCWLLGYNTYHRVGEADDAYNVFNAQYDAGVLLPTAEDWDAALKEPVDVFLDKLRATGEELLARARANPGHEEVETYTDGGRQVICIDLLVEADGAAEEGWVAVTLPDEEADLSVDDVYDFVAALIPEDAVPIYCNTFRGRARRKGEVVYKWDHYRANE